MDSNRVPATRNIARDGTVEALYVYNCQERYIQTIVSFVISGLGFSQQIILIESPDIYRILCDKLTALFKTTEWDSTLHYISNENEAGQTDIKERIVNELNIALENCPYNARRRVWIHVDPGIACAIFKQHVHSDVLVSAVDGSITTAKVQNEMLQYHPYLMTDDVCTLSPFSHTNHLCNASTSSKLRNEVDLYKLKSEFISVISHEVKNPVTIIKGYASLLKKYEDQFHDHDRDKLNTIMDCADIIDEEMQNILYTERFLAGQEVWRTEVIHIAPTIERVLRAMEVKSRLQNIYFMKTSNLHGNETMACNELALRLILSNIIGNAIKYGCENGFVQVNVYFNHHGLRVVVKDDGIGMSPNQIQQLFHKYGKLEHRTEGQGIGLYTVKTLIDKFAGAIDIISEESKGTTVTIDLPAHQSTRHLIEQN